MLVVSAKWNWQCMRGQGCPNENTHREQSRTIDCLRKGGSWQGSRIEENEGTGVTTVDMIINRDYEED